MGPVDSKSYQLRVRVTAEERDFLEKLRIERGRGETISDLVREAISLLGDPAAKGASKVRNAKTRRQVERLAVLLQREPRQVEEACIEGILDLIELKCEVPLIVMETHLHLKYRNRDEKENFPWNDEKRPEQNPGEDAAENPAPAPDSPSSS
jgi:hypothetical protein